MPKYLCISSPDQRWTLPETSDVADVERALVDALAAPRQMVDVIVDVVIDGRLARLHIRPSAVTAFAVVDAG